MNELKKINPISDSEIKNNGVQSLADRPNRSSQYGTANLSASDLKKAFDKLVTLVSGRLNDLIKALSSDEAADYIKVNIGEYVTLGDLISAISSGSLSKTLKVNPHATSNELLSLQSVINGFAKSFSDINEQGYFTADNIDVLMQTIGYNLKTICTTSRYLVKLRIEVHGFGTQSFCIPTDEKFNTAVMPGLTGNDVYKLFDDKIIYTTGYSHGTVFSLTRNTADNVWYASVIEMLEEGKYVPIAYPVTLGEIVDENIEDKRAIQEEKTARENSDASLQTQLNTARSKAVGLPTYDAKTGIMTFVTLDEKGTKTIDLPIESILSSVKLNNDASEIIFTFRNDDVINIPVSNLTLPTWISGISSASGSNLLIPPTTEAVRNYIASVVEAIEQKIYDANEGDYVNLIIEQNARILADNEIKSAAVGKPTVSGQDLVFNNLAGQELGRVTLPDGNSGGGGVNVVIRRFEQDGTVTITQDVKVVQCVFKDYYDPCWDIHEPGGVIIYTARDIGKYRVNIACDDEIRNDINSIYGGWDDQLYIYSYGHVMATVHFDDDSKNVTVLISKMNEEY